MRFRRHQEAATTHTRGLLALFVLVLLALLLAVNGALALVYWLSFPYATGYPRLFFETNSAIVLLFVLGGCWLESLRLREGGAHVARLMGGRPAQVSGHYASERLERRYANIVHEMAIASRVKAPAAWVLPRDDAINAFAAGWREDDAVIAVTRGALERLDRAELQGVVAHEFSHIVHGDTRLNMRLIGMVWGLQLLFTLGRSMAQPDEKGRHPATTLFGLALQAAGAMGWLAGRMLQSAVSRQREFLADASAVQYTRAVEGLGGALRKIAYQSARGASALRAAPEASLAHLYLSATRSWRWWATHPPIEERLKRLYGNHPCMPLPDPLLPPPADDEAVLALAPRSASAAVGNASPAPEALRHDATQNPDWHGRQARQAEALARIDRWHGNGQCRVALLLLLGQPAQRIHPAALRDAAHAELQALEPGMRIAVFEALARRVARGPRSDVRTLLHLARDPDADGLGRLRRITLKRLLAGRRMSAGFKALDHMTMEASAATASLAQALGLSEADARAWQLSVARALGMALGPVRASLRASLRLRRLHPMQAPVLARAWVEAIPSERLADERIADTLQLACRLLGTPHPHALARVRPEPQCRIL